mmetsp:Transcript_26246/g.47950  ORF Transcript_26246/g.47950 Transcript_26246/m.47950 type:complete len:314 (-) Transcript_26246:74-1015(-)
MFCHTWRRFRQLPWAGSWALIVLLWLQRNAPHDRIVVPGLTFASPVSRRGLVLVGTGISGTAVVRVGAAEAQPLARPPSGLCTDCLGVDNDGLLAPCRTRQGQVACVSSQDDRPEFFEPPWLHTERDFPMAMTSLREQVKRAGGVEVKVSEDGRYLRAEFIVDTLFGRDADDVEWYFTPDDTAVQFRGERRSGQRDFGYNRDRIEKIRIALGWEILPVVRNRQRILGFLESPFDNFGPSLYEALKESGGTADEEKMLRNQERRRAGLPVDPMQAIGEMIGFDDFTIENADGILDAKSRDFLRSTCDRNKRICD